MLGKINKNYTDFNSAQKNRELFHTNSKFFDVGEITYAIIIFREPSELLWQTNLGKNKKCTDSSCEQKVEDFFMVKYKQKRTNFSYVQKIKNFFRMYGKVYRVVNSSILPEFSKLAKGVTMAT